MKLESKVLQYYHYQIFIFYRKTYDRIQHIMIMNLGLVQLPHLRWKVNT